MGCTVCGENCKCGAHRFVDNTKEAAEVVVHHVPFKVEYEGDANVETKFTSKSCPLPTDPTVLSNQFRGRPLQGRKMDLPKDYEGLVVTDMKKPQLDSEDNADASEETKGKSQLSLDQRFDSMTYWNWDRVPSGMDKHVKLMDWVDVSQILHAPVGEV